MDLNLLCALLKQPAILEYHDSLPSTNSSLLALAREGAPAGSAVLAGRQSAGKGRRGRAFYSPPGGLYLSLLAGSRGRTPGQLTTLAAVAAARALDKQSVDGIHIKWVNDLLQHGKKVGGILCEGVIRDGRLDRTVVGIGLNLGSEPFPAELAGAAAHIRTNGRPLRYEQLAADIINNILDGIPGIPGHMPEYRARCLTLGKEVRFLYENEENTGLAMDVDEEGALLVHTDGKDLRLLAGDVSLIKPTA